MSATATMSYTTLELLTPTGPQFRRVSTAAPRTPTADEIPIIDLSSLEGDLTARKVLAAKFRSAAENTGFFYVKNHGISENLIDKVLDRIKVFFDQSLEEKEKISFSNCKGSSGYHGLGSTQINKTETPDRKETFSMRYDPRHDPAHIQPGRDQDLSIPDDDAIWDHTSAIPDFKASLIEFWQMRLQLARKMIRIFALALDLPEDFFDAVTTHPGSDAVFVHYPGCEQRESSTVDVGLGAHTDIQCLTLLWQDMSGGLQVLSVDGEWLDAAPIEDTLVVNIGDFLQRLSNNKFKSTVHRVYNRKAASRYSMPFFLGFNPEAVCSVVPTCVDEEHPALYPPISCGKWHQERLKLAQKKVTD